MTARILLAALAAASPTLAMAQTSAVHERGTENRNASENPPERDRPRQPRARVEFNHCDGFFEFIEQQLFALVSPVAACVLTRPL